MAKAGRVRISRKSIGVALLMVPFLLFVGIMAARQGSVFIGGALIVGTIVSGLGTLPGLSSRLDVIWDAAGVTGPSQVHGPFFLLGRTSIGWNEIAALGGNWCNYAYISAADGRRIYWTEMHLPAGKMYDALVRYRPDLIRE